MFYTATFNGTTMTTRHPARVGGGEGGRVSNQEYVSANLFLTPGHVEFKTQDGSVVVIAQLAENIRCTHPHLRVVRIAKAPDQRLGVCFRCELTQ